MKALLLLLIWVPTLASSTLRPRHKAPIFEAMAVQGEDTFKISLSEFKDKYVVLVFYPFDFTYVCPTELVAFSEKIAEFKALDTIILGISTDSHFSHLSWIKTDRKNGGVGYLEFPLISDFTKTISKNYGFLVEDAQDELCGAALRGLVIVDGKGIVRQLQINDAPVGRNVEEVIRTVQAFKHTDKYGVVCPANWKPGKRTIVPDQKVKLEYFNNEF